MNRRPRRSFQRLRISPLVLAAAIVVVLTSAVSGTLAWLIDSTETLTNTFTYGDISITLTETDTNRDGDDNPLTNTYEMVPGGVIHKDPRVIVGADSEDSWLFVKIEKSANFDQFMTFEMADGWIALPSIAGVYYREVVKSGVAQAFSVLKDDRVCVKLEVTSQMLRALDVNGNYPFLKVTAYAVQRDADIESIDTPEKAWLLTQQAR